jgi:hypothetical protein
MARISIAAFARIPQHRHNDGAFSGKHCRRGEPDDHG